MEGPKLVDDMEADEDLSSVASDQENGLLTEKNTPRQQKSKNPEPLDIGKMALSSIKSLKERKGSSFEDIKKHIEANCKINVDAATEKKLMNYLGSASDKGILTETDGKYKVAAARRTRSPKKRAKSKTTGRRRKSPAKGKSRTRSRSRRRKRTTAAKKTTTARRRSRKRTTAAKKKKTTTRRRSRKRKSGGAKKTAKRKTTKGKRKSGKKAATTTKKRRRSRKRAKKAEDDEDN